jgi:branched-chain amino acid transport system substrate-binding protein
MHTSAMMTVRRLRTSCVPALVLLLLAAAPAGAQPKAYRFGAVLPLTGNSATAGEWMRKGTELAVAEINANGGINGVPLEVVFEDSQSVPRGAVSAFTKVVTVDRVPFSHTALTGTTLAMLPIAEKHKVVLMNGGGISPRLGGASPMLFNQIPLGDFQFAVLARYAREDLKLERVAMIYRNDDYGNGMLDWAKKDLPKIKLTLVAAESFEPGSQDFRSQLAKIKAAAPTGIFLPAFGLEQANILKQAGELGLKVTWLGFTPFESRDIAQIAAVPAEGSRYTMPEALGPRYDALLAAFRARYKDAQPDYVLAGYYDATEIFAAGLRHLVAKGWEYTGDNVRKALLEMPATEGVFGKTQFAANGTVRKAISIKTFRGGKPAVVKTYGLDEVLRMQLD